MKTSNRKFLIDAAGNTCWGIVIEPDLPGEYPVILVFPGDGQKGNGTESTLSQLYDNGSPLAQARDGKLPNRIVIGLQGVNGQGIQPEQAGYALKHDIYPNFKTSYTMVTGLSLGAQCALELAGSPEYGHLPIFCVALSTPTIRNEKVDWANTECMSLLIHGKLDTNPLTEFNNSVRVDAAINKANPGYSALILVDGAGHDASLWSKYYTPGTAITIGNKTFKDIYDAGDYIAANETYLFPTSAQPSTGGGTTPPTTTTMKADFTVTTDKDGNFLLDPKASTGIPTSYGWDFRNAAGVYVKPEIVNGALAGNNLAPAALTVKPFKIDVNIILTMNQGVTKDTKTVAVKAGGVVIPPVDPVRTLVYTITTKVYKDAAGLTTSETTVV